MLTEIFDESVATGGLNKGHAQGPLNSKEGQEVEEVFLYGGKAKTVLPTDPDDLHGTPNAYLDDFLENKKKKSKKHKCSSSTPTSNSCDEASSSTPTSNSCDEACAAFRDVQRSKMAFFDNQGNTNNTSSRSTEVECMFKLEATEGFFVEEYAKAFTTLKSNATTHVMFMLMPEDKCRAWIKTL